MSRTRFGALLALAAVVVAAGGFLLGLALFDDDEPDTPPASRSDDGGEEPAGDGGDATTTTIAAPTGDVRTEALPSPSWIVVITSERDQARATTVAAEVAGDGHATGVLRSDEYQSLNPGFWVSYAGPYPDAGAAADAAATLTSEGRDGVYVRCAGTQPDCNPGGDGGDSDEDDDDG